MNASDEKISRRKFLHQTALVTAGSSALGRTALSYARIAGANDRISLGHIGVGARGGELDGLAAQFKDTKHIEMTAVCDLWTHNRELAVAANQKYYGRAPRAVQHPDMEAGGDGLVDQHATGRQRLEQGVGGGHGVHGARG